MVKVHLHPPIRRILTIVPHALIGAAAAQITTTPMAAFFVGIVTHLIFDFVPHLEPSTFFKKEYGDNWPRWVYAWIFLEFILTIIFFIWLFFNKPSHDFSLIIWGALGGLSIDLIDHNPFKQRTRQWFGFKQIHLIHKFFHKDLPRNLWYFGLILLILILGGAVWLLLKF